MKIAYIANYQEGTGYSIAAQENILALNSVGVDQVCRPIRITGSTGEVPEVIKTLEKNTLDDVDVVIQHSLPNNFTYKGGVLNVGIFSYETSNFRNSGWQNHLDMMDLIIVASKAEKQAIIETCGPWYSNKVAVVPFATNVDKYQKEYDKWDFGLPKDCLKFYTIAEMGRRKNLQSLLSAYYTAFSDSDNVCLIVKSSSSGRDEDAATNQFKQLSVEIKKYTRRFNTLDSFPKVILVTKYLLDEKIQALHQSCDVFCSSSYGEAHSLPFIDAMGHGNPVIVPQHTAFLDHFQYPWQGLLVPSYPMPCLAAEDAPANLYTSDETWGQIDITAMSNSMQYVHKTWYKWNDDKKINKRQSFVNETFNYANIGNQLKKAIEDAIQDRNDFKVNKSQNTQLQHIGGTNA